MVEVQNHLFVGTPTHMFDEQISGTIYVFDDKGKSSFNVTYPESDISNTGFGGYLSAAGDNIALRSISDQTDHDYFLPLSDVFYVFDGKTGEQLLSIDEPGLQDENQRSFIQYLESNGNFVMSGLNRSDHNPLQKTIYVFEGIPNTVTTTDYPLLILIAGVASGGIALGIVVFKKMKII